eukprot:6655859-Prorocentrum_lima.AAC.1
MATRIPSKTRLCCSVVPMTMMAPCRSAGTVIAAWVLRRSNLSPAPLSDIKAARALWSLPSK